MPDTKDTKSYFTSVDVKESCWEICLQQNYLKEGRRKKIKEILQASKKSYKGLSTLETRN